MSNSIKRFTSKQDLVSFVYEIYKAIEESEINLDLSIVLDSEEAEYLYNLLGYSEKLTMKMSDMENEFGDLSGKCLVTIFKTDNVIEVVAEDVYQLKQGEKSIKYHEADILVVLETDVQLVQKYAVRRAVIVDFGKETEAIRALLFE